MNADSVYCTFKFQFNFATIRMTASQGISVGGHLPSKMCKVLNLLLYEYDRKVLGIQKN